jgi:hypothetical protein
MAAERVVIDIEVNSDIATIEATREALERLTNAQQRYNRAQRNGNGNGGNGNGGGGGGGGGGNGRNNRNPRAPGVKGSGGGKGRYDGFAGKVFDFRGDAGKAIASYGALLKMVNKLSMISLPLLAGALGGISLAFQAGTYFIKMYKAAMSTLASTVGLAFVAITTLLAAQREFAAVQISPQYSKGTESSTDRFVAAGQAMSMFTDSTELAVIGAKGLQSAFTTLSKVKPVTGATVGAFTTLTDYVAGQGGDIEGNTKKLADFFAKMQKTGTVAGASAEAKALGPDFEKIIKEARALGYNSSEEFIKAANEGKLGETFATMYAGTLDALNNTVMGRFKQATSAIKAQLTDLGGDYLSETGGAIVRLQGIIQTTIARLAYVLNDFDAAGKMGSFMDMVQKASDKLIVVMTKYLGTSPDLFEFFGNSFNSIANAFDAMQDWMRQFQAAGTMINEYFFKPLFNTLGQSFSDSMESLSNTISDNGPQIESFANAIANTLKAIGKYGNEIRKLFITAMPAFVLILKGVEGFFKILGLFAKAAHEISKLLAKLGTFGKIAGGLVSVVALYSLFTIATRFFKTLGSMFGQDMKDKHIRANNVYVNGSTGLGTGTGGTPGGGGKPTGKWGTAKQLIKDNYSMGQFASGLALTMGGSYLMGKGGEAGGYDTAGGTALKTAGIAGIGTGTALMLAPSAAITAAGGLVSGGALTGLSATAAGAGAIAAPIAGAAAAYGIGSYAASKFNDDSVKSRMGAAGIGAAGGALTGAAAGAALTAWAGPGAIVGAVVGAGVGALIGGVTGYFKAGKQRKNIRKAAKGIAEEFGDAVQAGFEGGNVDDLLAARDKMMADQKKLILEGGDSAYAQQALEKYNEEFTKLNSQIDNYTGTVGISEKYFGVGAEALNKLADAAGIDLKEKMLNFREILNLVGKTAEEKARLIKVAWSNIGSFAVSEATSYFDKQQTAREQSKLVDASELRLKGGATGIENQQDFLKNLINYNVSKFGDTGGLANAYTALESQLGEGGGLSGLSDEVKASLRGELKAAGADPASVIKNVIATIGDKGLAELLGGSAGVPSSVMGKDGKTIDPAKLNALAIETMTGPGGAYFLANLAKAQEASAFVTPKQMPGKETASVFAQPGLQGAGAGALGTGAVPPASVVAPSYVSTTINASLLDYQTIRQIEAAVAKGLRDAKERGAVDAIPLATRR